MYRLIVESLLGLRLDVDKLHLAPCLPAEWPSCKVHYRYRETVHHITITQSKAGGTVTRVVLDGVEQADKAIRWWMIAGSTSPKSKWVVVERNLFRSSFRRNISGNCRERNERISVCQWWAIIERRNGMNSVLLPNNADHSCFDRVSRDVYLIIK